MVEPQWESLGARGYVFEDGLLHTICCRKYGTGLGSWRVGVGFISRAVVGWTNARGKQSHVPSHRRIGIFHKQAAILLHQYPILPHPMFFDSTLLLPPQKTPLLNSSSFHSSPPRWVPSSRPPPAPQSSSLPHSPSSPHTTARSAALTRRPTPAPKSPGSLP